MNSLFGSDEYLVRSGQYRTTTHSAVTEGEWLGTRRNGAGALYSRLTFDMLLRGYWVSQ